MIGSLIGTQRSHLCSGSRVLSLAVVVELTHVIATILARYLGRGLGIPLSYGAQHLAAGVAVEFSRPPMHR